MVLKVYNNLNIFLDESYFLAILHEVKINDFEDRKSVV